MKQTLLSLSIIAALSACSSDDDKVTEQSAAAPEFFVTDSEGNKTSVETFETVATKQLNPEGTYEISDANNGQSLYMPLEAVGTYGELSFNSAGDWSYTLWRGKEFSATPEHASVTDLVKAGLPDLTDTFEIKTADGTTKQFKVIIRGIDEDATFSGNIEKAVSRDTGKGNTNGTVNVADANPAEADFLPASAQPNVADGATEETATIQGMYGQITIKVIKKIEAVAADPDNGVAAVKGVAGKVEWTYDLDEMHADVVALPDSSQTLSDTFTLVSADGTEQVVTVLVLGADPIAATFTGDAKLTAVEGEAGQFTGKVGGNVGSLVSAISVEDPNYEEEFFKPLDVTATEFGSVSIDAAGLFTYNVDYSKDAVKALFSNDLLDPLPTIVDTLSFETIDGTLATVKLTIEGAQLVPAVIDGLPVVENGVSSTTVDMEANEAFGTLSITDVNKWQASFEATSYATTYGSFTINSTGNWSYKLSDATITLLEAGSLTLPVTDNITVDALDGTEVTLPVSIKEFVPANNRYLQLSSKGGTQGITNIDGFGKQPKGKLTLDVRMTDGPDVGYVQLFGANSNNPATAMVNLQLKSSGVIDIDKINDEAPEVKYTAGEWFPVELTWDSTQTPAQMSVSVDGKLVSDFATPSTATSSLAEGAFRISLRCGRGTDVPPTQCHFDNLKITHMSDDGDAVALNEKFQDMDVGDIDVSDNISLANGGRFKKHTTGYKHVNSEILEDGGAPSTQYAQLTHDSGYGLLRVDLPAQIPTGKAVVRVKVTDPVQSAYLSLFGNTGEQSRAMVDLNLKTDGSTQLRGVQSRLVTFDKNQRTYENINLDQSHTKGEWNTIEMTWDATNAVNDTADGGVGGVMPIVTMTINGEKVSDGAGGKITDGAFDSPSFISSNVVNGVKMLGFKCGTSANANAGTCDIDDIKIYQDVAGKQMIFSQSFEKSDLGTVAKGDIPAKDEVGHDTAKYGDSRLVTVVEVK
ncbi:hypothetical protein C2869_06280 [Saccharobesus litoralis]|uniref:Uncharacterized protein n=1 Tax=Saccharobesus litoralis TaxID=2172099 RepID=A0A2S0VPR2_9ALTE|nr:VCBS domain-containing protein [Saccharobesus litoralis]AWB66070.1 hypothetical protein C2869_06280 [Saccharobesus litoralis]